VSLDDLGLLEGSLLALERVAVFALLNLVFVRCLATLQARGVVRKLWIECIAIVFLIALDCAAIHVWRPHLSSQSASFIRRHALPLVFLAIIFLGATNSLVTMFIGHAGLVDFTNVIVGLLLIPLIVGVLRRAWRHEAGC